MLIVSYDIKNDKSRTHFSKFLEKFGYRLQYSVFQIRNSNKVLANIITEVERAFAHEFKQSDSVIIFQLSKQCKKTCYGYARNDEDTVLFVE